MSHPFTPPLGEEHHIRVLAVAVVRLCPLLLIPRHITHLNINTSSATYRWIHHDRIACHQFDDDDEYDADIIAHDEEQIDSVLDEALGGVINWGRDPQPTSFMLTSQTCAARYQLRVRLRQYMTSCHTQRHLVPLSIVGHRIHVCDLVDMLSSLPLLHQLDITHVTLPRRRQHGTWYVESIPLKHCIPATDATSSNDERSRSEHTYDEYQ
jgi:hypothetical protein